MKAPECRGLFVFCYFLVAEQESNQKIQPKGAYEQIAAPFGNPCRIAGGACG